MRPYITLTAIVLCGCTDLQTPPTDWAKSNRDAPANVVAASDIPKEKTPQAIPMGTGINIHLKGSDEVVKVWVRGKTEKDLKKEFEKDFADDGEMVLEIGDGETIQVEQDDIAMIQYKEMSSVMWILDAGNW